MKRLRYCIVSIVVSLLMVAPPVPAEETSSVRTARLDDLIQEALQRSPGLQAKRRAYEAAKARVGAAGLPEDPMIGVDVEGQSKLLRFSSRMDNEYMVSQTIPFPTTLWLRVRLAAKEAAVALQEYKEEERQIAWHIEQPYYELFLARKTVVALDELHALVQKLVAAARSRYESNQASQQDLLKAQIELSKGDIELFNWQVKAHVAEAHFSHILNQPLETLYVLAEETRNARPSYTMADLERMAVQARPELQAMGLGIAKAKTNRWIAMTNWLPEITGRIEARQFHGEDRVREKDTFIGISVPVWSLLKGAGGEWHAAAREVQAAEALYTEMKNEVWLAIHEADAQVAAAEHALRLYESSILPQAKQQVAVSLAGYEAGRTDFLTLIDAQRTLKETQMAYYQTAAEYELGLSNLRLAVGRPLEQEGEPSSGGTR